MPTTVLRAAVAAGAAVTLPIWADICLPLVGTWTVWALLRPMIGRWPVPRRRRARSRPALVRLKGSVDAQNADRTAHRLKAALRTTDTLLVVDLTQVENLTPNGSTAFLAALQAAQRRSVEVVIRGANVKVRSALRTAGLDHFVSHVRNAGEDGRPGPPAS